MPGEMSEQAGTAGQRQPSGRSSPAPQVVDAIMQELGRRLEELALNVTEFQRTQSTDRAQMIQNYQATAAMQQSLQALTAQIANLDSIVTSLRDSQATVQRDFELQRQANLARMQAHYRRGTSEDDDP